MKATIYDVAREAGVSIATVSQVINGKGKISEERRREILKIMEKLNYQPSVIAAALTGKKTYTLGLLVPDIANPFFAEFARAVEDEGHRVGYNLIFCSTDNREDRVERYLTLFRQKKVDGVIIGTGIENDKLLNPLVQQGVPVVLFAREAPDLPVHTVVVDDAGGGALAARHLAELGHRRFGVLAESPKISSSRERIRGFRAAVEEAGCELPDKFVAHCGPSVSDSKRYALDLLLRSDRPTALFCCNDLLAIGALQAAREIGLRVPQDISVVGFDDTILASVSDPPLTTVAQPIETIGKIVIDLLVNHGDSEKRRIVLQPELKIRHSTSSPGGRRPSGRRPSPTTGRENSGPSADGRTLRQTAD
ncbi:MAG: LacI family transcriptional regulator [Candidatus Reconcilbacillus cellulovorans]|uniref:LacI family transcriptional regulator n=1 Tax=Candidatus Reconcilbacillus cellulovorans TaxID=1906605 RepID=A0A2A6E1G3_9BACL|nr:MAG: LacI family transcriptional regulator [Candidatus Reconcilbacillus cellulovorans]